jgi:PAS domain S-box-containing protein
MGNPDKKEPINLFKLFFGNAVEDEALQYKINDLVPSIIYVYDANKKKLSYVNKKITDILGFEFEEINSWDDHLSSLVFKEDTELVKDELEKICSLQDNQTHTYNSRLNHKKGDWRYFRTTGSVLRRDEHGTPESFLFIAEDITSTLKSEEEIKGWKELVSETEDLLQFGTWSQLAPDGELQWSEGMHILFGYIEEPKPATVPADVYFGHVSAVDVDALKQKIKLGFENKTSFEHIYTITTVGGQEKIVSTKGKAITSATGDLIKFIGTTRDITEQINAYRQLYRYKQITIEREQFLECGSWEFDVPAGKLTWSEGMHRLFGQEPPANDDGAAITWDFIYRHLSQAEADRNKLEWQKILALKNNYVHDGVITTAAGKVKRLETYGKVTRDGDNKALKVMGITKDVTQLKEYEWELEKKMEELERSNKELEEFAYIASHDLQEPLRKITAFGSRINLEGEISSENKAYLTRMLSSAENMRILINNLLEFSRVAQKQSDFENADLSILLEEVRVDLELEIAETGTIINSDKLPRLYVIPLQIKQLFSNIILNAIKFRKAGDHANIRIASVMATEQDKKVFGLKPDTEYYKISISDNGIGFEQQYAERIFKIFQRLHGKAEYPGTGVGLAICRKITDNHGGYIFATGNPGEGSVFDIILPIRNHI